LCSHLAEGKLRVRRHLGAVDRKDSNMGPGWRQRTVQYLAEQVIQRALVTDTEPRDRGVIRRLIGRDLSERDVLATPALDSPRRVLPVSVALAPKEQRSWRCGAG
jgi:hypothetical protein